MQIACSHRHAYWTSHFQVVFCVKTGLQANFHGNQTHFPVKAFAPGLVLQRRKITKNGLFLSINLIFENKQKQRERDPRSETVVKLKHSLLQCGVV